MSVTKEQGAEFMASLGPPGGPRVRVWAYRNYILGRKKAWGSARGLIHYRAYVQSYLEAKRELLALKTTERQP